MTTTYTPHRVIEETMTGEQIAERARLAQIEGQKHSDMLTEAMHRARIEAQREREAANAAAAFNQIVSLIESNPGLADRLRAALGIKE